MPEAAQAADARLLPAKLHRFGLLGGAVIPDSCALFQEPPPPAVKPKNAEVPPPEEPPLAPPRPSRTLARSEILQILKESVRVQAVVQAEVSSLARRIIREGREKTEKNDKKKPKPVSLTFQEANARVEALGLPKEPFDNHGYTEAEFQEILVGYEDDQEVLAETQKMLHPMGRGKTCQRSTITCERLMEIHKFMALEMAKVVQEFVKISPEERLKYPAKSCEVAAELMVSMAVEQQYGVRSEDVEQAVGWNSEYLESNVEFALLTEELASHMQQLAAASQPRPPKEQFVEALKMLVSNAQAFKAFAKQAYEDYRARPSEITELYRRFAAFAESQISDDAKAALPPVELQLCYQEYCEDEAVKRLCADHSADLAAIGTSMVMPQSSNPKTPLGFPATPTKQKKVKISDVVAMHELMVDEMKRIAEAAARAQLCSRQERERQLGRQDVEAPWNPEVVLQMVQMLSTVAVERRCGTTAEDLRIGCFQHATQLLRNERYIRAAQKQQELMVTLTRLCAAAGPE